RWHSTEQRMEWFTWLKIQRTIFHLNHNIFFKLTIEWFKFIISLLYAINRNFIIVDKGAPHNNSTIWCYCFCEEISAVRVGALIILRAWLSLGIGFYSKSTKVRNILINLFSFICPPFNHTFIQRIGCG